MSDFAKRRPKAQRNSMFVKSSSLSRGDKAMRRLSLTEDDDATTSNVIAFARFRPLNYFEQEFGDAGHRYEADTTVVVVNVQEEEAFKFGRVFSPVATQEEVYLAIGQPSVHDVIAGYNATVFAYGQSGSGKTFTMMGSDVFHDEIRGVVPRAITDLFGAVMQTDDSVEFTFKCSLLEIYKEQLRDLFDTHSTDLRIKESPSRGIYVENLSEISVAEEEEMLDLLVMGERLRTVASTKLNAQSSRSHQLFMVEVKQKLPNDTEKRGVLNLVDLAGSEKIGWSGVTGNKLEETKKINLSLSALGNVIHALAAHSEHIPYRDSKLTRLLQESLGGNYRTYLVVTCSPSKRHLEETLATLKFGQRAGIIKNKVTVNIKQTPEAYLRIIDGLKGQLALLQTELRANKGEVPELGLNASMMSILTPPALPLTSPRRLFQSTDCSNPTIIEELGTDRTPKHHTTNSFSSVSLNFDPHEACEQVLTTERARFKRLSNELETASRRVKELEGALSRSYEKSLAAEQRANEYYNNYHKLFRLINKDADELQSLKVANESLVGQLKGLTRTLNDLDSKYQDTLHRNSSVRGSTVELENSEDLFMGEESVELNSFEEVFEEPSNVVDLRALPIGSFLLTQPLAHYEQLEKNTTLSRELLIFNLRNQVVHAGLINANLVRKYHSLEWKYCLAFHRYEERSLQVESLKQRVQSLEELLDSQHTSYASLIKLTDKMRFSVSGFEELSESPLKKMPSIAKLVSRKNRSNLMRVASFTPKAAIKSSSSILESLEQPQSIKLKVLEANLSIQQSFSHQLKKALEDSGVVVKLKEQMLTELEHRVYVAHKQETHSWRTFVAEFKTNMEAEVLRKHSEVSKLNEVLGGWIHKYLELQEVAGIPSVDRRNLSEEYVVKLNELISKTTLTVPVESPKIPKLDTRALEARTNMTAISMKRGDMTPPTSDR
jgi:kinesin family protein 5